MRTSKHGRSAHGDSDLGEGQAFRPQIRAAARAPHSVPHAEPAPHVLQQINPVPASTRYTAPTGKTI